MKKTTLIAAALATVFTTSSAFAWFGDDNGGNDGGKGRCMGGDRKGHFMKGERGKHGKRGNFKEHMDREFTAEEIRTLNEARLIMQGNDNVQLGEVTATDNGYKVTIVTKDNSLVKEMELAKNGMPLERYEAIKARMEAKDKN
ncbi:hypothetical protein [uncultured Endozoicomonas sp.]|uniref:hypothetical protein n=1 Tax=uncultured Endozoicomonas sp. TaxID=432652 RepID=UPI00261937C3|nr:hypothetical protein [uncultured Endozoicomonas sp.]